MSELRTTRQTTARLTGRDVIAVIWAFLGFGLSLALLTLGVYLLVVSPVSTDPAVTVPRGVGALAALVAGAVILVRYARLLGGLFRHRDINAARDTMRVDLVQLFLLVVLVTVMFPLVWIFSMSLDPRD